MLGIGLVRYVRPCVEVGDLLGPSTFGLRTHAGPLHPRGQTAGSPRYARVLARGTLHAGDAGLANRSFYGFRLWDQAAATDADLLWRVRTNLRSRYLETLPDESWLATIIPTSGPGRQTTTPLTVRVVDYRMDDGRDNPDCYRLLTTIFDPDAASAHDLVSVYSQRWEIECVFDEMKTHQRGPARPLAPTPPRTRKHSLGL